MKEFIIFLLIFLIIFGISVFVFNGRFIYTQVKYSLIGNPPITSISAQADLIKEYLLPERLIIPALGIEAPVVISRVNTETALQKDLENGVIFLPGSSRLGENGTMVIMGHSSAYPWYRGQYGSIFALLNRLNVNDEIVILAKNKQYTYRVLGTEIKAPKDLVFQKQENEPILYLVSCWPVNTAWKRIVVKTFQVLDNNY